MAKELVTKNPLVQIDRYLTLTAMHIPDGLDFEQWAKLGDGLDMSRRMMKGQSLMFYVGDWLCYGENSYADVGERYAEAIVKTGYDQGTLYNAKYVAGAVPAARRREELPWSHHQAVASLPPADQDAMLEQAITDELSLGQLRQLVAAIKNGVTDAESEVLAPGPTNASMTDEERKIKDVADALDELKRDIPMAQQMAEDFFTLATATLDTLSDVGNIDITAVANFQATSKALSEVCARVFKDLGSLV